MGRVWAFPSVGHSYRVVITVHLPSLLSRTTQKSHQENENEAHFAEFIALYAIVGAFAHTCPVILPSFHNSFHPEQSVELIAVTVILSSLHLSTHLLVWSRAFSIDPQYVSISKSYHSSFYVSVTVTLNQISACWKNTVAVHHPIPRLKYMCVFMSVTRTPLFVPTPTPSKLWRLA